MSSIVAFRQNIMDVMRLGVPDLSHIDWYDGVFDEADLEEWGFMAPAAFVSVNTVPDSEELGTGEINLCLGCLVTIVATDQNQARDADTQAWRLMEEVAVLVNLNKFGDKNAAPANTVRLKRLRDPALRRNGIAIGVVEWNSGYAIGERSFQRRDQFFYPNGDRLTQFPRHTTIQSLDSQGQLAPIAEIDWDDPTTLSTE